MEQKFDPGNGLTYCVGNNQVGECPGAGSPCYGSANNGVAPTIGTYPRMHLMPSGLVITCGGQVAVRSFDPVTGRWAQSDTDFNLQALRGFIFATTSQHFVGEGKDFTRWWVSYVR